MNFRISAESPSPNRLNSAGVVSLTSSIEEVTATASLVCDKEEEPISNHKCNKSPNRSPLLSPKRLKPKGSKTSCLHNWSSSPRLWQLRRESNESHPVRPASQHARVRLGDNDLHYPNTYAVQELELTNNLFPRPSASPMNARPTLPHLTGPIKISRPKATVDRDLNEVTSSRITSPFQVRKKPRLSMSSRPSSSPSVDSAFGGVSVEPVCAIAGGKAESDILMKNVRKFRETPSTPLDVLWQKHTDTIHRLIESETRKKMILAQSKVVNKGLPEGVLHQIFQARMNESAVVAAEKLLYALSEVEELANNTRMEFVRKQLKKEELRAQLIAEKTELISKLSMIPVDIPSIQCSDHPRDNSQEKIHLIKELSSLEIELKELVNETTIGSAKLTIYNEVSLLNTKLRCMLVSQGILSCVTENRICSLTLPFLTIRLDLDTGEQQFEHHGDHEKLTDIKMQLSTFNSLKTNLNIWLKAYHLSDRSKDDKN